MIPFINTAYAQGVGWTSTVLDTAATSVATSAKPSGLIPACAIKPGGADSLECVMELFINIGNVLFTILGSVMLVVFVYGGVLYLFSQGDSSKVTKATTAIKGGVVGFLIVVGAFTLVTFAVNTLRGKPAGYDMQGQYVTCGVSYTGSDGKTVDRSINDGQACAPGGFQCKLGACTDKDDVVFGSGASGTTITPETP